MNIEPRRWKLLIAVGSVLAVAAAAIIAGTAIFTRHGTGPAASASADAASSSPRPSPSPTSAGPVLTAAQRVGQRIIYSYAGLTPPASLLQHIRDGEAAGVIFFSENVASTAQIAGVIQQFQQAQRASPIRAPLLLMTDQEGGQVRRLPGQPVLSAKEIGESANPGAQATAAGTGAAGTLGGVGMNVNLAPVLDVAYAPGNFIDQYQRSFSGDAGTVAALGADFVRAQQAQRVAATAKHFPGLGAAGAGQNTDMAPVTITVSLSNLRARDEVPYADSIAAGVKLIMVSWAVYPALDAALPAGLSPTVVQSELRTRLHYTGVTVTDALEAGALAAYGTPAQRAVLAAQAGMDLILCAARDVGQGENAATGLANALAAGQLDAVTFTAAVNRVTALRESLATV